MIGRSFPKVLAITKRTAELCATQTQLHMSGIDLVTATSMAMAGVILRSMPVKGVIVCKDSWTDDEREQIVREVSVLIPDVQVLMRCVGCIGCDEATGTPGVMTDSAPLSQFISALDLTSPKS